MYLIVEVLTEDVLVAHEQELSRLQSYYEQHKDLLEKVERWKKLWAQFLEFEVCYRVVLVMYTLMKACTHCGKLERLWSCFLFYPV